MPKIAKLVQSPRESAVIVELKDDEVAMLTGMMGGCCSIVVLWGGLGPAGFNRVRGHHAGGGPGNVAWDALLKDVPPGPETKVVMSCAPADYSGPYSYIDPVKEELTKRGYGCRRSFEMYANAYIDRNGAARPFDEAREAGFEIRNKDARPIF